MTKRFIFTGIWTVIIFIGSAGLLFAVWRLYFAVANPSGQQPSERTFLWMGISFAFVPIALGLAGAVLGILGRLPGTRKPDK
jgi:cell division protein FtsX